MSTFPNSKVTPRCHKIRDAIFAFLILACCAATISAQKEKLPAPQTRVPSGVSESVWLSLEKAGAGGADLPL
jgi:hypothetical protein